jgi:hypothetical protein
MKTCQEQLNKLKIDVKKIDHKLYLYVLSNN